MVFINRSVNHTVIRHYPAHTLYRPVIHIGHAALSKVGHYLPDGQTGLAVVITRVEYVLYLEERMKWLCSGS
jgi:hypothetical protein